MNILSPIEMQMLEFNGFTTTREGMINKFFKELIEYKKYNGEIDIEVAITILHDCGLDLEDLSTKEYKTLLTITT